MIIPVPILILATTLVNTDASTAPCSAGDYMTESGCQQCGENTYSAAGASSCTPCPDGKLSDPGSSHEDDCKYALRCPAGEYMIESGCLPCGYNTFSAAAGATSCTPCPDGTLSGRGSTSVDDCKYAPCSAGDYMTESGCQQCGENTFSAAGASSCTPCPDGKLSDPGSPHEDDCKYGLSSAKSIMTTGGFLMIANILSQLI